LLSPEDGATLEKPYANDTIQALSPDQIATLSPGTAAIYHLLAGDEPNQVDANLAALPDAIKLQLANLSPATVYQQIHAPIYLLHDRSDQFVPVSESRSFAQALANSHHAYDYAEFGIFQHVEVKANQSTFQLLGDASILIRVLSEILQPGA
jgi:hypothetical protein